MPFAGNITVLRVALSAYQKIMTEDDIWVDQPLLRAGTRADLYSTPDTSLAGLTLKQRGEGYRLAPMWREAIADMWAERSWGADVRVGYTQEQIAVYLYAHSSTAKWMWDPKEVISFWPRNEQLPEILASMPAEKAEKVARLPFEMREWKEKRGDELENW